MLQNVPKGKMSRLRTPPPEPKTYRSSEVAQIANVTLRQLQWWDERSIIPVRHLGHRRKYEESDVLQVCVLAELRRKGLSLQVIRKALRKLQRDIAANIGEAWPAGNLWLVVGVLGTVLQAKRRGEPARFVRKGEILGLVRSREELADLVSSHPGSVVVVSITAQAWKAAA